MKNEKNVTKNKKKYICTTEKTVKKSLIEECGGLENLNPVQMDKVNDYMSLWETKRLLIDDINRRGIAVQYTNGKDQTGITDNKSVAQLLKVTERMEGIRKSLLDEIMKRPPDEFEEGYDDL